MAGARQATVNDLYRVDRKAELVGGKLVSVVVQPL